MKLALRLLGVTGAAAIALVGSTASAAFQAVSPAPAAASAPPLSAETFAQLPGVSAPQISPDGKRIAAEIARDGKLYFAIATIDGGEPLLVQEGGIDINEWHWVNNDWLVVRAGQLSSVEGDPWYVSRAFSVNATTAKILSLAPEDAAQSADNVLWYAHDGSPRVLLAYQRSIYSNTEAFWPGVDEVDVSTGKHKGVMAGRSGVMDWYADANGFVRMGIGRSESGDKMEVLYRKPGNSIFRSVESSNADSHVIVPALFLADPTKALVLDDDEQGFRALYELDLATLRRGKQVAGTPGYDLEDLVIDDRGDTVLGVRTRQAGPAIRWIDPDLQALDAEIAGAVRGGVTQIASVDRTHQNAIFYVGGGDAPGAYLYYDRAKKQVETLGFVNPILKLKKINPVKTIHYKARDGLDIPAILTTPFGKPATGLPLIVMPHGGPSTRDSEEWDWWPQFLASRGYAVIQPNYRGSTGYGTGFAKKAEGQWGLAMQDDLNDAVTALAGLGIADPGRVCIVGGSYGGYAAIRAAQRDGKLYRCAASFAGISDMGAMVRYDRNFLYGDASADWHRKQAPDLKGVSPINFIGQFSTPLLLVHGKVDQVVPVKQSRDLAAKLKAAGKTVDYIEQPQGDHHLSRYEDRLSLLKALEAFLAKYNPA